MPKRTQKRARKSEAKDSESDEAPSSTNKRPKKNEVITIKQHFSGTVNTIRRAAFGAPGSGIKASISYFKSTTISSQSELEVFCSKIKRHAHLRVKGPAGRVAQASPLADACESESIDFGSGEAIVLAVWSNRRREPCIKSILSDASAIRVELRNEGMNMSATQRSSGVKYGSFAAALVELENNEPRDLKFCGDTDRLLD